MHNRETLLAKKIYLQLLRWSFLRRPLRKWRARLLSAAGCSDPYADMARLSRAAKADLFLDIGCHDGSTLLRFLEAGIRCPVIAFDPLEVNLRAARENLSHFPKVRFEQLALSDQDGTARFFVNRNNQTSSLLENAQGNVESFRKDTELIGSIDVPVRRLDTWFAPQPHPRPRSILIKCDTQGAEGKVIRGGIDLFREQVAAIYAEVMLGQMYDGQADFSTLRDLLEDQCGLILHNIYPCLHDSRGRAVQMDALWIRPCLGTLSCDSFVHASN